MSLARWKHIFVFSALAALICVYPVLYLRVMTSSEQRAGSDFVAFYSAGQVVRQAGFGQAYRVDSQRLVQAQVAGFDLAEGQVLLYNHLPFLLPLLALIAAPDYLAAFLLWQVILAGLYGLALWPWLGHRPGAEKLATGLFFPLFFSLLNGQDTALVFLGVALWALFLLDGRDFAAGLALGLVTARPQLAILLMAGFLFQRRRVLGGFALSAGALAFFSLILLGWDGTQDFLGILGLSAGGEWYGMKEGAMPNFLGALARIFPQQLALARLAAWGAFVGAVCGAVWLWRRESLTVAQKVAFLVLMALFFSPHLHFHDLALLLLPLLALKRSAAWITGVNFLLLAAYVFSPGQFVLPYAAMLGCAVSAGVVPYRASKR